VKKRLGGELVKCLAIKGPDYHHHMHSLFTTIANRVMVCEIAQDIFDIIYRKSLICPYSLDNKVTVHRCDVDELSPINCRYADIDLMRTIKNNYDIVSGQLKKQDDFCSKDEEKYFTFTFTRRSQGGDIFGRTLLYLEKLVKEHFGMELIGLSDGTDVCEQHGKFKSCKQHFLLAKKYGRVNKMYVFTYQDDVPMMNVLIAYK